VEETKGVNLIPRLFLSSLESLSLRLPLDAVLTDWLPGLMLLSVKGVALGHRLCAVLRHCLFVQFAGGVKYWLNVSWWPVECFPFSFKKLNQAVSLQWIVQRDSWTREPPWSPWRQRGALTSNVFRISDGGLRNNLNSLYSLMWQPSFVVPYLATLSVLRPYSVGGKGEVHPRTGREDTEGE